MQVLRFVANVFDPLAIDKQVLSCIWFCIREKGLTPSAVVSPNREKILERSGRRRPLLAWRPSVSCLVAMWRLLTIHTEKRKKTQVRCGVKKYSISYWWGRGRYACTYTLHLSFSY